MSRFGRCLVAMLSVVALACVSVASASAATTTVEFLPGKGAIKGTSGEGFLLTVEGPTVKCTSDKFSGTFNSTTLATVKIDFEGCESSGFKCNSTSPLKDGTGIILAEFDAKPVWILKTGELEGLLFKPVAGSTTFVSFECTALVKVVVKGELLCNLAPVGSHDSKTFTVKCEEAAKGKSKFTEYTTQLEPSVATKVNPLLAEINGSGKFEEGALANTETLETELLSEMMV
jgi:hypothetical protein